MKAFAGLYTALDETTKITEKRAALVAYLASVEAAEAAWAVYFLSGRRLNRLVKRASLAAWASEESNVPPWLFDESQEMVGDFAETLSMLLPEPTSSRAEPLDWWIAERLIPLGNATAELQRELILASWRELAGTERYVFNKLITGAFRVGVSRQVVTQAIAELSGLTDQVVAHRLMGDWEPDAAFWKALVSPDATAAREGQPYPFFLAHALDVPANELGDLQDWIVERKWDGIRAQVVSREGRIDIWSRGEERVTDRYPEILRLATQLPAGTVLDGELLAMDAGRVLPFAALQQRIGRKAPGRKALQDAPVDFLAFDLLEWQGEDWRARPLRERRAQLEALAAGMQGRLRLSEALTPADWDELARERARSRELRCEGLMLKRADCAYGVGRTRGDWWKWKIDPLTADCVLVGAQAGRGRRATLFTDYTFAVRGRSGELVAFAKAYSGLTDEEIDRVDAFVRQHTVARHGPVRMVEPLLVFELGFEGIQRSPRHKSGIAVRFPRILRQRLDKKPADADSVESLEALLLSIEGASPSAAPPPEEDEQLTLDLGADFP